MFTRVRREGCVGAGKAMRGRAGTKCQCAWCTGYMGGGGCTRAKLWATMREADKLQSWGERNKPEYNLSSQ